MFQSVFIVHRCILSVNQYNIGDPQTICVYLLISEGINKTVPLCCKVLLIGIILSLLPYVAVGRLYYQLGSWVKHLGKTR